MYHTNWHKNNLGAIRIPKLKFVVHLLIRRDFDYDLPLCMIFKCGQFNLSPTRDTAEIVSFKIILDIVKVEHWQQAKRLSVMLNMLAKHIIASDSYAEINLSKQSREYNYDCKTHLRSVFMHNYIYVPISIMIGDKVSKSIIYDRQTNQHPFV